MRPWLALLLTLGALVGPLESAQAATRRFAVVAGNNRGAGMRRPLRFAEADAEKVAGVLVELGGMAPADVRLLLGQGRARLEEALEETRRQVAGWARTDADRAVVLVYYSGHSDGEALELGRERFSFTDLRARLEATGADVRLAIVDACRSGALLETKGGSLAPDFDIRMVEDVVSSGQALLTSSAANEIALESREIGGSFFTHHLVSGLRGAADASGDGRVTLGEAYQYAFTRTVSSTAATLTGPQHPAYDYRLSGQGDLVLADLTHPTGVVALPEGFTRALVLQVEHDRVVAEVAARARGQVVVVPGEYEVRLWRGRQASRGRVSVGVGGRAEVRWEALEPYTPPEGHAKGDAPSGWAAALLGGGRRSPSAVGALGGARLTVGRAGDGLVLGGAFGTGRDVGYRESSAQLFVGAQAGIDLGPGRLFAGLEAGAGAVWQALDRGVTGSSGLVSLAPVAGALVPIAGPLRLTVEVEAAAWGMRRDGALAVTFAPAIWVGFAIGASGE